MWVEIKLYIYETLDIDGYSKFHYHFIFKTMAIFEQLVKKMKYDNLALTDTKDIEDDKQFSTSIMSEKNFSSINLHKNFPFLDNIFYVN